MPGPSTPKIFCRHCGYDLHAQPASDSPRCPECGTPFDLLNPKTYRPHPPRSALYRWTKRASLLLLSLIVALGSTWGWLYWGWKAEQTAVVKIGASRFYVEPLGGKRLQSYLGPCGWVLDRVDDVHLPDTTTDAELVHLEDLKRLQFLWLSGTQFTDAGLIHLQKLPRLRRLELDYTNVTGVGLVHLANRTSLRDLNARGATITDAGLSQLKDQTELEFLDLSETNITDAGLVHLAGLSKLTYLSLRDTKVADAGLIQLKDLKALRLLDLGRTKVSDAGLAHFYGLKALHDLSLDQTRVTRAGVDALQAALPGIWISGDHSVTGPPSDPLAPLPPAP